MRLHREVLLRTSVAQISHEFPELQLGQDLLISSPPQILTARLIKARHDVLDCSNRPQTPELSSVTDATVSPRILVSSSSANA